MGELSHIHEHTAAKKSENDLKNLPSHLLIHISFCDQDVCGGVIIHSSYTFKSTPSLEADLPYNKVVQLSILTVAMVKCSIIVTSTVKKL